MVCFIKYTVCIRCIYSSFFRCFIKYTVICGVYGVYISLYMCVYTVYLQQLFQVFHQIYGHTRRIRRIRF
jgi:hypothetical protein